MEEKMDIDDSTCAQVPNKEKMKENGKGVLVIMVGAPGSGKSTFCENVMASSSRPWARVCQDNINNGKSGTRVQCISSTAVALKEKKSVFIDRCNLERKQRVDFLKLGSSEVDVHAVVLDLPAKLCISRSVKRSGHEGNLQGGKAAAVVNRMLQKKELPKLNEGFSRITLCINESDVQDAVTMYSRLGPSDTLPSGYFGQKSENANIQLGIMKFLKKVDNPAKGTESSLTTHSVEEKKSNEEAPEDKSFGSTSIEKKDTKRMVEKSTSGTVALMKPSVDTSLLDSVPTLAFPSLSTADFQFDHEKASDIIVEKVEEYTKKLGTARFVLVDLTHKSKILSLVKVKSAQRKIDSEKFFTFVGDITCLYSKGGLRCNVIANAANWRLKPGGGGVNAAIYVAAGPSLEIATRECAKSLAPGKAVVVPVPSASPLVSREGVTHVIHVLGPNMNPQRPNCLKNDYDEGGKILREAYSSLFEGFASILKGKSKESKGVDEKIQLKESKVQDHSARKQVNQNGFDQKMKREGVQNDERSKKYKGLNYDLESGIADLEKNGKEKQEKPTKSKGNASKMWTSWAQALYNIAMDPVKHNKDVLEIRTDVIVLNDLYPKAKKHLLVLARCDGLDQLADVRREHLQLLKTMHEVGMKWAEKFLQDNESLIFRLGFHSVPSMRQLHLHVVSQDFDSPCLKHKKHWNSFNTDFFRDSLDVVEEVDKHGKASLSDESLLSKELRCHRCRSAHPNIPRLKSHISNCQAPFPVALVQNGSLVHAPANPNANA